VPGWPRTQRLTPAHRRRRGRRHGRPPGRRARRGIPARHLHLSALHPPGSLGRGTDGVWVRPSRGRWHTTNGNHPRLPPTLSPPIRRRTSMGDFFAESQRPRGVLLPRGHNPDRAGRWSSPVSGADGHPAARRIVAWPPTHEGTPATLAPLPTTDKRPDYRESRRPGRLCQCPYAALRRGMATTRRCDR
jgi:hypothetical protein